MIGEIGVLIPLMGIGCGMLGIWTKHQQKMAEMQVRTTAEISAEKAAQYVSQTRELEERVRVLERIVTDKSATLASRIEDMREPAM
jgi:hypothetical protein